MRQTLIYELIEFYSILEKCHIQQPQGLCYAVAVVSISKKVERVILLHITDDPVK